MAYLKVKINDKEYTLFDHAVLQENDGSIVIDAARWMPRRNGGGYYRSVYIKIPSVLRTIVEFDGATYSCMGMSPADVLRLRGHIEACLALEGL